MKQWQYRSLIIITILLLVTLPFLLNRQIMGIMVSVAMFAYLATAWNIVGGLVGLHSFGHSLFIGAGAYTTTYLFLSFGLSPWIGLIVGMVIASILGCGVSFLSSKYQVRGIYYALSTFAFAEIARISVSQVDALGGSYGLLLPKKTGFLAFQFQDYWPYWYIIVLALAVSIWLKKKLVNSKFGYYLASIRENEDAAAASGVNIVKYKVLPTVISAALSAFGGTFYMQFYKFIDPDVVLGMNFSVKVMLISILGGIGTTWGPLLGSVILIPLGEFVRLYLQNIVGNGYMIIYGIVLVLVIMYLPRGVWGFIKRIFDTSNCESRFTKIEEVQLTPLKEVNRQIDNGLQPEHHVGDKLVLTVNNVSKQFGGLVALEDVSFSVKQCELLGIIGPNGAGKTTLFNTISGSFEPTSGQILLDGQKKINGMKPHEVCKNGVARTFQLTKAFNELTVLENVMIGAFNQTNSVIEARRLSEEILRKTYLDPWSNLTAGSLTLARRKRLELARCLATNPRILLLDEVMSGLTPTETKEYVTILRNIASSMKLSIILIEHVMEVIMKECDRIVVIHHGQKLAEGSPEIVSKNPRVIEAYLGIKKGLKVSVS